MLVRGVTLPQFQHGIQRPSKRSVHPGRSPDILPFPGELLLEEGEEMLRVRGPKDPVEGVIAQSLQEGVSDAGEASDVPVVHEQEWAEAEGVTVRLGHDGAGGGGPDMGQDPGAQDYFGQLPKVVVAPGGSDGAKPTRIPAGEAFPVPGEASSHAEPVAVQGFFPHVGVDALVDKGVLGLGEERTQLDRRGLVVDEAAHGNSWERVEGKGKGLRVHHGVRSHEATTHETRHAKALARMGQICPVIPEVTPRVPVDGGLHKSS